MNAVVLHENLNKALAVASRVVATKAQVAILGNVLLREKDGAMEVVATNLEMGVRLVVPGKIEKGFEITVPARQLAEFVSGVPKGQIEMEVSEGRLSVRSASFKAGLSGISASEFPVVASVSGEETIILKKKEFVEAMEKVVFAAASDEGRPVLTGVMIEAGEKVVVMVATDGYRLSKAVIEREKPKNDKKNFKMLVPARAVGELLRLCSENGTENDVEAWLTPEASQVVFGLGGVELVSRLIEGNFPDYQKIIPKGGETSVEIDREELIRAVKLASIFARDSANIVKLSFEGGKAKISASSPQMGVNEGEVEIEKTGGDMEIAFNDRYLLELLNNLTTASVSMRLDGPLSPAGFYEGEEFLHIITPVRVSG